MLIPGVEMTTVKGGGHFLPLDRPRELTEAIIASPRAALFELRGGRRRRHRVRLRDDIGGHVQACCTLSIGSGR
jgi:hypothetical protein